VIDHPFFRAHRFCRRHRYGVLALCGAVTLAAVASLWWVPFDKTLESMLPAGSSVPRMMEVLRNTRFSGKIVISVGAEPNASRQDLLDAADWLADALEPPLISRATADFSQTGSLEDLALFFRAAPQILDEPDLSAMEGRFTPEGVRSALRERYIELIKPEGSFLAGAIRSDPLGIRRRLIGRLETVRSSFGYEVNLEEGHLISRDGRHCMVLAETPVSPTDGSRSKELAAFLAEKTATLPPGYHADLVCGHLHTVSNEKTMKRDIALTNGVASIAFLALFFLVFRDVRAVLTIFVIPVAAALIAIPLTALFFKGLALIVVGLGAVIAGVAVDYAVHVFVAARRSGNASEAMFHIALPVSLGACTTCGMFLAFFTASVPGYRQLALFSILSILISLTIALLVFPHFVRPRPGHAGAPEKGEEAAGYGARANLLVAAGWMVLFAVSLLLARGVRFDSNVLRLDGTEKSILAAEERFRATWGQLDDSQAILVCAAATEEDAIRLSDQVYRAMRQEEPDVRCATLSAVWPSRATREENVQRWRAFWTEERERTLRKLIAEQGREFGFAANAFAPFFEQLQAGTQMTDGDATNAVLARLKEQFLRKQEHGWQALSFYPDTPASRSVLKPIVAHDRRLFLVSPKALANELSGAYGREILKISTVAVGIILLVTFAMVRNVRITLISLVPSATAAVALLAILAVGGWSLNMANLIAGISVFGLSLDYGFVMMHGYRHRLAAETQTSVHVSAITTVIGTAALLFARHPALFSIGFTLTIGILVGYAAAMWVVPALYALLVRKPAAVAQAAPRPDSRF